MSNLHRKTLKITTQKFGYTVLDGADVHPPSPPPPPPLEIHSISPLKVFMICSLAATFSFVCYIAIIKTCRAFRNRSRTRSSSHGNRNETHQDFIDEDHESVVFHPIWLINTIGLNQSVIDSIQIIKYRKKDGLIGGTDSGSDCAICLGEFQDEESLRILPKCSHAFHVTCIDTWLRSHKNCPVCRAPVVNNTSIHQVDRNTTESSPQEDIPIGVFENETLLLENAKQIDTSGESSENKSLFNGDRVQSDLTDHRHQKVELIRRSVSMDMADFVDRGSRELMGAKKPNILQKSTKGRGSRSSISIYSRARKSSSFGRS